MLRDRKSLAAEAIPVAYRLLRRHNGDQHWWPGSSPLEISVGAILTQNTAWTNVAQAIRALKRERLLSLRGLRDVPAARLEQAIRPAGYYRQKVRKLKAFVRFIDAQHAGSLKRMARVETADLRRQLLGVWGIGPETADSILLYALEHPVFVVDTYTQRIAVRHGWIGEKPRYADLQALFVRHLPKSVTLYNDYHAQLVWVGKHHCGTKPRCAGCPLAELGTLPLARLDQRHSDSSAAGSNR